MKAPTALRIFRLVSCIALSAIAGASQAADALEVEAALVFSASNDVGVPGDSGTRFSLTDDLNAQRSGAFRLRYSHNFGNRHWVALLAAPLSVTSRGNFNTPVNFAGRSFPANRPVQATFRFDSYRLIYRYHWLESNNFELSVGGALKLRDAVIRLSSAGIQAKKANTGLVPLLSLRAAWKLRERLSLIIDGEALAAPQGRAEDILFAAQYKLNDDLALIAGYRLLEGGADNDEVYTFSWFNSLVAGLRWSLSGD